MWHAMSVPRGQSCTVSNCHVAKTMPLQLNCGVRDLFKTKFCRDIFNFFFFARTKIKTRPNYKDELHIYASLY